jgi:translation initiation factor IF-3
VRLIAADGEQLGIVHLNVAKQQARVAGLDLVEMSAAADPPVVRIMDVNKAEYDARKQAKKASKPNEAKELRFQVGIDQGDLKTKIRRARQFLEKGDTVTAVILTLRGRKGPGHQEGAFIAHRLVAHLKDELADVGTMAKSAMMGIRLKARFEPKKSGAEGKKGKA